MASQALQDFEQRLAQVQQLVDAHGALIRIKKADEAHANAAGDLAKIGEVVSALVSKPGKGRPPEVQALNGAAITLLSGHLQGFLKDLHAEAAKALFADRLDDVKTLIGVAPTRGNPNRDNINRLFGSLGFSELVDGISWKGMGNDALKKNLREFNQVRNKIAHGAGESVRKQQVVNYMKKWTNLAKELDKVVGTRITKLTGAAPW